MKRAAWKYFTRSFSIRKSCGPASTSTAITTEAARRIADIALALRNRGVESHVAAHFLDRIVFCFFAEDIGLLPNDLFHKLLENTKNTPRTLCRDRSQFIRIDGFRGDISARI